jgi:hypothetical protein
LASVYQKFRQKNFQGIAETHLYAQVGYGLGKGG